MGREEEIYDAAFVEALFDRSARHYGRWSAVATFGLASVWRRRCTERLPGFAAVSRHKGARLNTKTPDVLDLMSGTGEVWPHVLRLYPEARIRALDISGEMQQQARGRMQGPLEHRFRPERGDALSHDLGKETADIVVSTFGLSVLSLQGQEKLARQIALSLRPGGIFSFIETTEPKGRALQPLFNVHLKVVLPAIARLFPRGAQDLSLLGAYTRDFSCDHFAECLRSQGLFVSQRAHTFGCANSLAGFKPLADADLAP